MAYVGYFLGPIFGPKIVLTVYHLWVVADDGYFLSPKSDPKLFFEYLDCGQRCIFFCESDLATPNFSYSRLSPPNGPFDNV